MWENRLTVTGLSVRARVVLRWNSCTIPVHEGCTESSETPAKSSGTLPRTAKKILELIRQDTTITVSEIAMSLGMSTRGVEKNLRMLRESGIIRRAGSPTFGGNWEVLLGKGTLE